MAIFNNNSAEQELKIDRFSQCLKKYIQGTDVISGVNYSLKDSITLPKKSVLIMELK